LSFPQHLHTRILYAAVKTFISCFMFIQNEFH
jgi:hypothetical protein